MNQEMCCGGTCVRSMCEYHKTDVSFERAKRLIVRNECDISFGEWRLLSDCGHYVQIWRSGKLVDEVPA